MRMSAIYGWRAGRERADQPSRASCYIAMLGIAVRQRASMCISEAAAFCYTHSGLYIAASDGMKAANQRPT